MTTTVPHPRPAATGPRPRAAHRSGWRVLLVASAVVSAGTFLVVAAALGDLEAAAYAVAYAVGAALAHRRRGRLGAALLGLANLNVLVWMSIGALSNVTGGQRLLFVFVPTLLSALALTGAAAAAAVLARPDGPGRRGPRLTAGAAAVVVVAVSVVAAATGDGPEEPDGVLLVTSDNVLFNETELAAPASGELTVRMANGDLFWHTFTIDELGVDLWVPVGAERDVTFDAPPGDYTYYCRVPGHEARMRGTLVVG